MARWKATYTRPKSLPDYLYFNSADARSMSPKAVQAAIDKAKARALVVLEKQGVTDAEVTAVNCVG